MFHMSLFEQNNIRNGQINKFLPEFKMGNNKKYKVKAICDSTVYVKEVDGHLLKLYYLVI